MAWLASPEHETRARRISSRWMRHRSRARNVARDSRKQEQTMLDTLMLALAAGFFALAIGYTYACERL
jgi:hypothetical protein